MEKETFGWGKLINRWHDEGNLFHLLRADNSPACGVSYFMSAGPYPADWAKYNRCRRCQRIADKGGDKP
jgi:hypothetical protein